ncbi:hypothetical protein [Pseudoblastomonas halimionae]|uniref:Uncharacterized protein n=1 Tax=Alteriqipengyuania halimionae TaxID=1926630 RepID=A0A6I4U0R6_9SPHN|nr:hypothetical protein [Alteriqipengyuania halimionae]MXP09550.1 hypothetical protein [Alteriqipengyuania halimionae]
MTDFTFWTAREETAQFSAPGECAKRATRFERTIRNRNLVEFVAGGLVLVMFGAAAIGALAYGLWDFGAAFLAGFIGVGFVLWHLHSAGSNLARQPESDCRTHYRRQLDRQRQLLESVPLWYLAPMLPGILGVYGAVGFRVARNQGWHTALEGIGLPLAGTVVFFAFVAWLNRATARGLAREIDRLDH